MFESGNKLMLNGNFESLYLPNDIDPSISERSQLEPIWMTSNDQALVLETAVAYNRDHTNWQSFIVISINGKQTAVDVDTANRIFLIYGTRKPSEIKKSVDKKEEPKKPEVNTKDELVNYLAKKYGLDLDKENESLKEEKRYNKIESEVYGPTMTMDNISIECDNCASGNHCIYYKIAKNLEVTSINCSNIRAIDIIVNERDLSDIGGENEK